jgi:poly-gamma-glutamate synthesis protein (capsule biosynthesis protein)
VLAYQVEIARAAIDAGADIVLGHGPHLPLGIEIYKHKPIFYGVGSFSFETGHRARTHPDWIGLMLHVTVEDAALVRAAFTFVRHNAQNETVPRPIAAEQAALDQLRRLSTRFATALVVEGDEVVVCDVRQSSNAMMTRGGGTPPPRGGTTRTLDTNLREGL